MLSDREDVLVATAAHIHDHEVIRPALTDREGWAVFIGTPMGRNQFHALYEQAKADPSWLAALFRASETAIIPATELAEAAKGTLTVVLTGEGGDELFAGYGRYRRALRPAWLGGRPAEPQVAAPFLKGGGAGALARWRKAGAPPAGLRHARDRRTHCARV